VSDVNPSPRSRTEEVRFSSKVYSLETIKRAAYRFIDRFSSEFQVQPDEIVCTIHFTGPTSAEAAKTAIGELHSEVLDQDLRQRISAETAGMRNAILAVAFAPSKLQDSE
jgi:His-Xaa-Ser system protein HxsD